MNAATPRSVRPLSLILLIVATAYLGYLSGFPDGFGVVVASVGVLASAVLSEAGPGRAGPYAPVPVLGVLVLEAATAPAGFGTELIAGLAGVAFLVWLADDPSRPVHGPRRGFPAIALSSVALGIAWTSALFLPAGAFPLGVAGALLAVAIAAVAYLVGSPTLFDREEA